MWKYAYSNRIFVLAGISVISLLLTNLFLHQVHAQSLTVQSNYSDVSSVSGLTSGPMLEMHIANNGLVLLRGARVTSVTGSIIHAEMTWTPTNFTWAIDTQYHAKILNSKGEKETLADINVGDIISASGQIMDISGAEPTIDARIVRESAI